MVVIIWWLSVCEMQFRLKNLLKLFKVLPSAGQYPIYNIRHTNHFCTTKVVSVCGILFGVRLKLYEFLPLLHHFGYAQIMFFRSSWRGKYDSVVTFKKVT